MLFRSWLWLAGLWASGLTFVLGVVYAMLQEAERERGIALSVLSLMAFVVALAFRLRQTRSRTDEPATKPESTVLSRAYRTASAKLTSDILETLAKSEADMQQLAASEQWPLDTSACEAASASAKGAFESKQFSGALKEFAKSKIGRAHV